MATYLATQQFATRPTSSTTQVTDIDLLDEFNEHHNQLQQQQQHFAFRDFVETDSDALNDANKRRLYLLRTESRVSPAGYRHACEELQTWCDDPRAFAPSLAIALDETIRVISECATAVGYDPRPCIAVYRTLARHRFDMHPIAIQRFEFYMNTLLVPYRERRLIEIEQALKRETRRTRGDVKKPRGLHIGTFSHGTNSGTNSVEITTPKAASGLSVSDVESLYSPTKIKAYTDALLVVADSQQSSTDNLEDDA